MAIAADTPSVDVAVRTGAREYLARFLGSRRMARVRLLIDGLIALCALEARDATGDPALGCLAARREVTATTLTVVAPAWREHDAHAQLDAGRV